METYDEYSNWMVWLNNNNLHPKANDVAIILIEIKQCRNSLDELDQRVRQGGWTEEEFDIIHDKQSNLKKKIMDCYVKIKYLTT